MAGAQYNRKQKKTDTIYIDAISGNIKMKNSLKEGRMCLVRIENVNPLATKNELKMEAGMLSYDVPAAIKGKAEGSKDTQTKNDSTKFLMEFKYVTNKEKVFLDNLDRFSESVDSLNNFLALDTMMRDLLETCIAKRDSIEDIIKAYFRVSTLNTVHAVGIRDSATHLIRNITNAFRALKESYKNIPDPEENESGPKKYELKGDITTPSVKGKKVTKQSITGLLTEKKEPSKKPYEKEFTAAEKLYEQVLNGENVLKAKKISGEISKKVLLFKNTDFYQYSGAYDVREDYFVLEGKVTDKKGNTVYEMPKAIKIPTRGGVRWNFSVGTAIEWGDVRGKKYKFDNTDSTVTIYEFNNTNIFSPFPLGLVHVYYRFNTWVTPAISFGILPNLTDLEESRYRVGLSALVGNQSKIIVSLGWSGGKTEWIKPGFTNNHMYDKESWQFKEIKSKSFVADDFIEKVFKSGFFFGISYNLSKTDNETSN